MELFKGVNVDWMGKAKYFVALSLILLVVGWASILKHGGLRYGIDFRGGTLVYVRFAGPAPIDQIRKGLSAAGLNDSTIQSISDSVLGSGSQHDVVIGLELKSQSNDASLDAGREAIVNVLHKTFGTADAGGKLDFNSVGKTALAALADCKRIRWRSARLPAIATISWRSACWPRAMPIIAGSSPTLTS